jgi:hypothetical protein
MLLRPRRHCRGASKKDIGLFAGFAAQVGEAALGQEEGHLSYFTAHLVENIRHFGATVSFTDLFLDVSRSVREEVSRAHAGLSQVSRRGQCVVACLVPIVVADRCNTWGTSFLEKKGCVPHIGCYELRRFLGRSFLGLCQATP